ncbi:polyketide cyclase [Streptomyces yokosukanensis]|uniref:Polyketide cyclase n=1 Tax=Streptomyces yokosukanensis TaxID=67386 RepID=A0A101P6L0_9ACTN|nr:nuclear transport factor 2 family protein [Streptomyces yokosukanensis]KUN05884.1 polyketide cyclase [Streptomyces yokosukanensis]
MSVNTDRYESAAARYFEAWNTTEPEALKKAVADAWTADGGYTDPLADVRGHEGIAAVIAAAHEQFPGFVFRPLGSVDGHHDVARFAWELVSDAGGTTPEEGSAPVAGFDVVTLDDEGRIRQVLGFLDRVPADA